MSLVKTFNKANNFNDWRDYEFYNQYYGNNNGRINLRDHGFDQKSHRAF